MRLKKRYIGLAVFLLILLLMQTEFMAFRKSEEKQRSEMMDMGQTPPEFHSLAYKNIDLHYTKVGAPGRPLLFLVHGSPGSSADMMDYLADTLLSRHAQLIAADRPGFGYSEYGKTFYSLQEQSDALLEIIRLQQAPKVILMGHSYGGPVIARMAADAPELVDGICIVAGSVDPELEPREWWRAPLEWPVIRSIIPGSFRASNLEIMKLYQDLLLLLPEWQKINCAVSVVHGQKDRLVPVGNAEFLQRVLKHCDRFQLHLIPDENHFILWSQHPLIRSILLDMIATPE